MIYIFVISDVYSKESFFLSGLIVVAQRGWSAEGRSGKPEKFIRKKD